MDVQELTGGGAAVEETDGYGESMCMQVSRDSVVAFRLRAHHLSERLEEGNLAEAAGQCGIQNSPPGSALLALHARVRGVGPGSLETAVGEEKSLLQTWSMRGSPFFFPTGQAGVFTTGVLPPDERARRHLIRGVEWALDRLGMSLDEAVRLTEAAVREALTGRRLAVNDLGARAARQISAILRSDQRGLWEEDGPYAAGQPLGEAVVHFCLRILALRQVVCFAPRAGNKAPFVLMEEWLEEPVPPLEPPQARAELLRRYLRSYGPSTRAHFAVWLGVRTGDVDPWWELIGEELVPVDFEGTAWLLAADVEKLSGSTMPTGVRLLPPGDPYTQLRDRETVVEKHHHREVWKTAGSPGTVLIDGHIAGIWRPRKTGKNLHLRFHVFRDVSGQQKEALVAEAADIAPLRGASSVTVEFEN